MTTKISIDIPDSIYTTIKKKSLDATVHEGKFVGMNDIILPILEKAFGKKN